jgi:hypothetical protein
MASRDTTIKPPRGFRLLQASLIQHNLKREGDTIVKKVAFNIFCLLVLTSFLTFQIGCASFPPPHANSFYTKDEVVTVTMLTCKSLGAYDEEWEKSFEDDWKKSFEPLHIPYPCVEKVTPIVPLMIGIVAPLAFDYAKNKLKQETENYMQQFGTTYFDTFWRGSSPKYCGFVIKRKAKRYNDKTPDPAKEVFKIVYGLAKDNEGFFWAAPLYFQTNKTKAKVVSWPWGGKHRIDTKLELSLDAVWIDGQKQYHKENIATFDPLMVKDYEIDNPKVLRASCPEKTPTDKTKDSACSPLKGGLNSFAVPIPSGTSSLDTGDSGKFWLTVLVTESDTAKTKKYISDLSDLLEKNRDKIIDFIKKPSQ